MKGLLPGEGLFFVKKIMNFSCTKKGPQTGGLLKQTV